MTYRIAPLGIAALFLALAGFAPAHASSHGPSGHAAHSEPGGHAGHSAADTATEASAAATAAPAAPDTELAHGEVVRRDASAGKLTLRHGELKNLAMPPMTMVFRLQAPNPAVALTPGTPVRFHAEDQRGALVITRIEAER